MNNYVEISKQNAIKLMEQNLVEVRKHYNKNTFYLLSYDLEKNIFIGDNRLDMKGGMRILNKSKTFILNKDTDEQNAASILSIYTAIQYNIYNIMPIGEKHDMIIITPLNLSKYQ